MAGITFLFIAFIVYNSFIKKDEVASVEEVSVSNMDRDTKKIIGVLDQIDKINLDTSFFSRKSSGEGYVLTFNELEDFSQPIPNKRPGKINPFVIGGAINYLDVEDKDAAIEVIDNLKDNNQDGEVVEEKVIEE